MPVTIVMPIVYSSINKTFNPIIILFSFMHKRGHEAPHCLFIPRGIINHILRNCPVLLQYELTGCILPYDLCAT